ncbi:hypothetical protein [Streptomyces sp. H27-C3]|uniref:hypothetical protein n=1 Tax=Streptomyces sp. H27-C3 TaxID=3046305 RepID=UPI0024B8A8A8|nr:hypothetical protein [Streptomyces sp. H27-C3]MDJ0462236.1 hypothetical protein [Streptomyces sp. H27-C3]
MTMPPPQQPSGPYGPSQPPNPNPNPTPNPYAQQPYPPQQFPQQQPYPGHPGQQGRPYPGQGAWQQPPMGPPPARSRTGKVLGIIAVVLVVVVGGLVFAVYKLVGSGSGSGGSFPAAEYKLTVPPTLLDGRYKLAQDMSQTEGKKVVEGSYDPDIRDPKAAVAQYSAGSPLAPSVVVVSGMYGQFKAPDEARGKMLDGAAKGNGATVVVPAKEITPAGSDVTLSCQVLTTTQNGVTVTLPMCAWADGNTGASVAEVTPETSKQDPASVDLAKVAETTVKVRDEVRKPIG